MKAGTWRKSPNLFEAFGNAGRGVADALRREWKLRLLLPSGVAALAAGLWLNVSAVALALLIFISAAVVAVEMINSALETVLDSLLPDYHEGARRAKDLAAGAVLVLSLAAVVVGLVLFWPPFIQIFF